MSDEFETECSQNSWRVGVSYSIAALCLGVFLATLVFLGIVIRTSKFTYNMYIVFLLLPDAFLNLVLGIRSIYDGIRESGGDSSSISEESFPLPLLLCRFQQIGIGFYISNIFLDAVVTKEVYDLVWNSYRRKRTKPPTVRKVVCQSLVVYALVSIFVAWCVAPTSWAGMTIENDPYCSVSYGSEKVPAWVTLVLFNVILMPPIVYVVWTCAIIDQRNLLPLKGRTRALAMYFLRIIGTFIFFYTPMTIIYIVYVYYPIDDHTSNTYFWLQSIFTILNPIQNIVSIAVFSMKDDIKQSVLSLAKLSTIMKRFTTVTSSSTTPNTNSHSNDDTQNEWKQDDIYNEEYNSDDDGDGEDASKSMWTSLPLSLLGGTRQPKTEQMFSEASVVEDIEAAKAGAISPIPKTQPKKCSSTTMNDAEDHQESINAASSPF